MEFCNVFSRIYVNVWIQELALPAKLTTNFFFCIKVGSNVDKWLNELSATRILPLGISDENVAQSKNGGMNNTCGTIMSLIFNCFRRIFISCFKAKKKISMLGWKF